MKTPTNLLSENNVERKIIKRRKTFSRKKSRQKILMDLEQIYEIALDANSFAVALRAIELRGKELGLFCSSEKKRENQKSLEEMTEEELCALLNKSCPS